MFEVGKTYTRMSVQAALGISNPTTKGKWGTGYINHGGAFYVFANVGVSGRTGHDYPNRWRGAEFEWSGKSHTTLEQPEARRLLEPRRTVHIFTRDDARAEFAYHGPGTPVAAFGSKPITVVWTFVAPPAKPASRLPLDSGYRPGARPNGSAGTIEIFLQFDRGSLERALTSHADLQDAIATRLKERGVVFRSPVAGEPQFDIAWESAEGLHLVEVKSLHVRNEAEQVRYGLGQLFHYKAALQARGTRVATMYLAVEQRPRDPALIQACELANVSLIAADELDDLITA